jgi:hypothetical protein
MSERDPMFKAELERVRRDNWERMKWPGGERKPDPKDERITFLESEVERLKSGLDDIEQIVFAQRLKEEAKAGNWGR